MRLLLEDVSKPWDLLLTVHLVRILRLLPGEEVVRRCEPALCLHAITGIVSATQLRLLLVI